MNGTCPFCLEVTNHGYYHHADWPYPDRILAENEGAIAVPAIGPLVNPWALVISKNHCPSFLSANKEDRRAMLGLVKQLKDSGEFGMFQGKPSPVLILEHGGTSEGNQSCACIDHCHLHVLHNMQIVRDRFEKDVPHTRAYFNSASEREDRSYLFVGEYDDYDGKNQLVGALSVAPAPRKQFFRHLIASSLGLPGNHSDWRYRMNPPWMTSLYRAFHPQM